MPKTIAIVSGKGGVGKTTLAVNLACSLHAQGESVLLVDGNTDHPAVGMHLTGGIHTKTLHAYAQGRIGFTQAINYDPSGLKYIPGTPSENGVLPSHLAIFNNQADIVIYDAPPGKAADVMRCADQVIIVTEPDIAALLAAHSMARQAQAQGKIIAALVLNKYVRADIDIDHVERFMGMGVASTIPYDERLPHSIGSEPYVRAHPRRKGARSISELAVRISMRPRSDAPHI